MKLPPPEIFKLLSVDTRVRIIELLKSQGPLGTKGIAQMLGITPAAASQHLKLLRQAGLVKSKRSGYFIPYTLDEEALECCRQVLNEVCRCGCRPDMCGEHQKGEEERDLKSLKRYQERLLEELRIVRKRIERIEAQRK